MNKLNRLFLSLFYRFLYSYEMVNAYLAANMGEVDVAANHESQAGQAARRLAVLEIQS
jgi:hypothetical protein